MSQMGMQMPGAQRRRVSTLNVYTALLFLAVLCLAAGVVVMWGAATRVSPESGFTAPFKIQPAGQIQLSS